MAEPAKIDLTTVKRGDTYIVDFFFTDTDGTKDISAVTIDAQARREMDGALWFDLKPVKVDASNGHFRIHLTHDETRSITESPPGSFSGIFDIQFSWQGASEVYVSTVVAGSISISKDVTQPVILSTSGTSPMVPPSSQEVNVYLSLNPGTPNYSDVVTAEQLTPVQYDLAASLGLANVNAINEAGEAARAAEKFAAEAYDSKESARQSATLATIQATKATNEADRAKSEADKAKQVSGLDTVEQAVDMALGEFAGLMTESEARAINRINEAKYAASGFVHMGKHYEPSNVNEGLTVRATDPTYTNEVFLGSPVWTGNGDSGASKTMFAKVNIAGAVANILNVDQYSTTRLGATIKLPEAPDGTDVYDSTGDCRGSGKASLDLRYDTDPKYGDIPTGTEEEILREAVSRAFEGQVKNGDFRDGSANWENFGNHSVQNFANGECAVTNITGSVGGVQCSEYTVIPNTEYVVEFTVVSGLVSGIRRTILKNSHNPNNETIAQGLGVGHHKIRYTSPDGHTTNALWFEGGGSREDFTISNVSIRPATEEVVTHPVDLVGLEYYEEELTGRQEIFECIQSLSTTFGKTSVPTVLSTRKLSYFQQYDGQFPEVTVDPDYINDRYRCVVWDDLTEPQKREVAAYMGEKLFKGVNGHIVNGRLRARTIRGAGNGDWASIDSTSSSVLRFSSPTKVRPQASNDTVPEFTQANSGNYGGFGNLYTDGSEVGVYKAYSNSSGLYQGRCFLYVVATVPRANKGAYHPDLNPYGTRVFNENTGGWGNFEWHNPVVDTSKYTSKDCFLITNGNPANGHGYGAYSKSGAIGQNSGHPDGIFYDGILDGGLNGIIDWRLPAVANDSPEEAAKVEAKVENGTYRGLEKLVRTKTDKIKSVYQSAGYVYFYYETNRSANVALVNGAYRNTDVSALLQISTGKVCLLWHNHSHGEAEYFTVSPDSPNQLHALGIPLHSVDLGDDYALITPDYLGTNLSVSGEFNTQMVIGDPANILQTDALKDGWLGTWCPVIPDGVSRIPLNRKSLVSSTTQTYTSNNGGSWTSGTIGIDSVKNDRNPVGSGAIVLMPYKAFAKQTKPSTNKPVYNGKAGLMGVFNTQASKQSTLSESLTGKVLKSSGANLPYGTTNALTDFTLIDAGYTGNKKIWGKLGEIDGQFPNHTKLRLGNPINNSPAIKVLPYQTSNNGQGSIGYQANELTWDTITYALIDGSSTTAAPYSGVKFNQGAFAGYRGVVLVNLVNVNLDATYSLVEDYIVRDTDGLKAVRLNSSGWGDDSTIKVTADGSDTFVDLNGNTNLSVVHELAIPYTWTSNHARAGEQVEGVDL